jgi:hypothetical protein
MPSISPSLIKKKTRETCHKNVRATRPVLCKARVKKKKRKREKKPSNQAHMRGSEGETHVLKRVTKMHTLQLQSTCATTTSLQSTCDLQGTGPKNKKEKRKP